MGKGKQRERAKILFQIELDTNCRYEYPMINRTVLCNGKHSCDFEPQHLLHFYCFELCVFEKWYNILKHSSNRVHFRLWNAEYDDFVHRLRFRDGIKFRSKVSVFKTFPIEYQSCDDAIDWRKSYGLQKIRRKKNLKFPLKVASYQSKAAP